MSGDCLLPALKAPTDPSIMAGNEEQRKADPKQILMLMNRTEEDRNQMLMSNNQTLVTTAEELVQVAPNVNNPEGDPDSVQMKCRGICYQNIGCECSAL
jgi:hypothetical protein